MPSVRWSRRFASSMRAQVRVQLRLRRERGAVDALELRVALVAAPVGARERQHLERLDVAGALDVRAAAQVDEVAVLEVRDLLALRDRLDDLDLVLLAARARTARSASSRGTTCRTNGRFSAMILRHLRFDARGVLGRERLGVEVVVEAVLDRRTDRDLGVRAQAPDGVRHHVRRRVPHARQRIVRDVALVAGPDGSLLLHHDEAAARRDCREPAAGSVRRHGRD